MGLEDIDYSSEGSEGGSEKSQESSRESQEKKEKASKAMAGIQRTRKDEKKAQKDNDYLYEIIVEIIQNKDYDILIPFIVDLLRIGAPSNIILGGLSLVNDDAVFIIRNNYLPGNKGIIVKKDKNNNFKLDILYKPTLDPVEFNENRLDEHLKNRINEWIDDIFSIISFDPSTIISKRFIEMSKDDENSDMIIRFITAIITFFFFRLNIIISKDKAVLYSEFIIQEAIKRIKSLKLEEIDII